MKRFFLIATALFLSLSAGAQTETYPSYVQVNGRAEREVKPDEFYLSIEINELDSKGKITVAAQQRAMITRLKSLGIDTEKQLTVADLSSEFYKKRTALAKAFYRLKLTSVEQLSAAWKTLSELNISNVQLSKVAYSQADQLKSEVRKAAMQDAKRCAEELAEACGQSLGACFYIYDSNYDIMLRNYGVQPMMGSKMATDEVALEEEEMPEFKTMKVEYQIQAKFVLK